MTIVFLGFGWLIAGITSYVKKSKWWVKSVYPRVDEKSVAEYCRKMDWFAIVGGVAMIAYGILFVYKLLPSPALLAIVVLMIASTVFFGVWIYQKYDKVFLEKQQNK